MKPERPLSGGVFEALPHDSAPLHVAGEARYVDDIPEPSGTLYAALGVSSEVHARVLGIDLEPVRRAPGVMAVVAAADIPGTNNIGPVVPDEPVFADTLVQFRGQPLFAVAATTVELARRAARRARVQYEPLEPIVTIEQALGKQSFVLPTVRMTRGNPQPAQSAHLLSGKLRCGGQEHFYLEGHVALALPGEGRDMHVYSSTQHPTEVQHLVAAALGLPDAAVTVELRRMGGGFGGKETQGAVFAIAAALLARATRRPVKLRVDRDDDMVGSGKRHDFLYEYAVGFDAEGSIEALELSMASRCGLSADLSGSVNDRAVFHVDNAYYLPNVRIESHRCKTHTVSSTAFRGFGGPQGMFAIENVIAAVARRLGIDPLQVRKRNLYGPAPRNETPYGMALEDNVLPALIAELEERSDYWTRREAVSRFNGTSKLFKKGLGLTPVKFGIAYTSIPMNQGGALVHLYTDGSVHLNHGGTEMGQGLFMKVAQMVAEEFQIDVERVHVTATSTGKVPNTSPTAASSGSDLNGMAALNAAVEIRTRMTEVAAEHFGVPAPDILFSANRIYAGNRSMSFAELALLSWDKRVSLSATGYYRTPKIHWDFATNTGRPFYYFAYGAAAAEVAVDTLTGETRVLRAELLQDCGRSLNPAIDLGQIEGAFVQGMGWLTSEELWWDAQGRLRTHGPSTYKIPGSRDVPPIFNARILADTANPEATVFRSKAVGEPPLMLAISVYLAIRDAVASLAGHRIAPQLDAPATPERVLAAVDDIRGNL